MKGAHALNWWGCLGMHSWERGLVSSCPGMFLARGVPADGWAVPLWLVLRLMLLQMMRQSDAAVADDEAVNAAAPQSCSHTRQDATCACREKNAGYPSVKTWSSGLIPGAACCEMLRR